MINIKKLGILITNSKDGVKYLYAFYMVCDKYKYA